MRKLLTAMMFSLALASMAHVEAKSFSSSRSSFSTSRSSAPSIKPSYSAPSRIGGGTSVGMRRPDVMPNTRPAQPAAVMTPAQVSQRPTTGYSSNNYGSSSSYRGSSGSSAGGSFMAGLGGGLVGGMFGSMIGNALTSPHHVAAPVAAAGIPQGVVSPGYPGMAPAIAPMASTSSMLGSIVGIIVNLLLIAALLYLAYWLFKKARTHLSKINDKSTSKTSVSQIDSVSYPTSKSTPTLAPYNSVSPSLPIITFFGIQNAFAQGNREQLAKMLGPDMVEALEVLPEPNPGASHTISGLSYEVLDEGPLLTSIRYMGRDTNPLDGGPLDEVWHFVKTNDGQWVLNGVEQVE